MPEVKEEKSSSKSEWIRLLGACTVGAAAALVIVRTGPPLKLQLTPEQVQQMLNDRTMMTFFKTPLRKAVVRITP